MQTLVAPPSLNVIFKFTVQNQNCTVSKTINSVVSFVVVVFLLTELV